MKQQLTMSQPKEQEKQIYCWQTLSLTTKLDTLAENASDSDVVHLNITVKPLFFEVMEFIESELTWQFKNNDHLTYSF